MNEDMVYIGTRKYQSYGVCNDKLIQRTDLTLKSILENKINDMFFNKNTIANIAEQDVPNFKNMTKKMQNTFLTKHYINI